MGTRAFPEGIWTKVTLVVLIKMNAKKVTEGPKNERKSQQYSQSSVHS